MDEAGIGAALMAARARLGWSREALAYHSGVSWSAIAQIESGRRKDLRLTTLLALADALDVTIDYLVRGTKPAGLLAHRLLLYGSEDELRACVVPYLAEGIERSEFLLVVTTSRNSELVRDALGDDASRVVFIDASAWYRSPGAALRAYRKVLEEHARPGAPWLRIIGEPGYGRRSRAELAAWARYEALINLAWASMPATIICLYDTRSTAPGELTDARRTHPELCSAGEVADSPTYADPAELLLELR